jgi:hypothetical protein
MDHHQININDHMNNISCELDDPQINKQRKRHLEDMFDLLDSYHKNHPDKIECPPYLELYCDKNPNAIECRIHDL